MKIRQDLLDTPYIQIMIMMYSITNESINYFRIYKIRLIPYIPPAWQIVHQPHRAATACRFCVGRAATLHFLYTGIQRLVFLYRQTQFCGIYICAAIVLFQTLL